MSTHLCSVEDPGPVWPMRDPPAPRDRIQNEPGWGTDPKSIADPRRRPQRGRGRRW